jgi:hypothetical protein
MMKDQDVLDPRRVPRYTSSRTARTAPTRQRRPLPDRRRTRYRRGNARLVVAAVLVLVAVVGVASVRSATGPDIDGVIAANRVARVVGPRVSVPREILPSVPGRVMTLRGIADGAVSLTANGEPVEVDSGGGFSVHLPQAWTEVRLVSEDASGEHGEIVVPVTADLKRAEHPRTVAVHVSADGWSRPEVHDQIVAMIKAGQINAVELDIKDDDGGIGYETNVPLAHRIGAVWAYYDAREAIDELHGLGVRVIGRIVNFLDPVLAKWAWANGRPEMIVLDGSGREPLANDYGTAAFTNFAHPKVRQYHIDLAREAVRLGFDEILYDYTRRPEGNLDEMQFPGLDMPPDVSIARFVADTKSALKGTRAMLGVSIFGISASRPEPTAQDVRLLAPLVDYISPMVYPGLWNSGEYRVESPVRQPAEIVTASLKDFELLVAGTDAAVRPWLQDFSARNVAYGPAEVRAQIDAALATGSDGFILWNFNSVYHAEALQPM